MGDVKYESAKAEAGRTAYRPILQVQDSNAYSSNVEIRTTGDAASLAPMVRQAIGQVDGKLPIFGVTTLREQLSGALQQEKLIAELVSFFGLLALLLAGIGLYGVMAHGVVRRTKEIGIRMALGAERRRIVWMVLREVFALTATGLGIGLAGAWATSQFVESFLFGIKPNDPLSISVSVLVLIAAVSLAGYAPAWKASRIDPMVALRHE